MKTFDSYFGVKIDEKKRTSPELPFGLNVWGYDVVSTPFNQGL